MKILVINGSPKGERSDTLKVTRAFVEGMGETFETIDSMRVNVKPCLGCYACWWKTPGVCAQQDDMAEILKRILQSDLVIWSMPLYCYGAPSNCKVLFDRLLPLSTPGVEVDDEGKNYHQGRQEIHTKIMLVSGCGFPDRENNYEGLEFAFTRMFSSDCPMICCVEAPLLGIPEAKPVADGYLEYARRAGAEYKAAGRISAETQALLDAPMFPPDEYRARINGR
ncbi:MAG: flavodoxin family protein [Clostridiales bacterium]|nr:flavodoxin family protein [Clostridiales bacterium]